MTLLGGLAQFYSDNLSQETKKGWAERRAQGLYCGFLPFGAMKGEGGGPVPHPDTYPGLFMTFELAVQGKSGRDIAMALNAAGYRTAGIKVIDLSPGIRSTACSTTDFIWAIYPTAVMAGSRENTSPS